MKVLDVEVFRVGPRTDIAGIPLSLEVPASHCAHLSALQRAHAVARCTRKLLEVTRA